MKLNPNDRWGGSGVAVNGPVLRVLRQWAGLNAADLADAAGLHRSYLSKLESGAVLRVSPSVYQRLLAVMRIDDRRVLLACMTCCCDPTESGIEPTTEPTPDQPADTSVEGFGDGAYAQTA